MENQIQDNFRDIAQDEFDEIIKNSEGDFSDFKSILFAQSEISVKKVEHLIVALANSNGGNVYLGITDDGHPDGYSSIENYNDIITAIFYGISPAISSLKKYFLKFKNKFILLIEVPRSSVAHKAADGNYYERNGSSTHRVADAENIMRLYRRKGIRSFEEETKEVELGLITKSDYINKFLRKIKMTDDAESFLRRNNFIYDNKPRISSIVCFCDEPQSITKCGVRIFRYEFQKSSRQYEYNRERVSDDDFYITGPLELLIRDSIAKIQLILSGMGVGYPVLAVQEALVNAVLHRDYFIQDEIHVKIYDNQLEIISPGGFPEGITEKNILKAPRIARNPQILGLLFKISSEETDRNLRLSQNAGEGVKTIFNEMKRASLADPIFKEVDIDGNQRVIVVLKHSSAKSYERKIIEYLKEFGSISNREAREITREEDKEKIKNIFKKMENRKTIEKVDPNVSRSKIRYRLKEQNADNDWQTSFNFYY